MEDFIRTGSSSDLNKILKIKYEQDENIVKIMKEHIVPEDIKEKFYYLMLNISTEKDIITLDFVKSRYGYTLKTSSEYLASNSLYFSELSDAFKFIIKKLSSKK